MTTEPSSKSKNLLGTGISGLDNILGGGFPKNRVYLIQGTPGVGKTTLALQFLLEGINQGDKVLYITLSETKEELESVAASHDWNLDRINLLELSTLAEALADDSDNTFFQPSEVALNKTTKVLLDEVERVKPTRVVFDSLSELRMLAETPLRYRRQILSLKQFFSGKKCTVLLLDDLTSGDADLQIESIAHGVIALQKTSPGFGGNRRQLNIQKIRGVQFRDGHHDYVIKKGGINIFPRLIATEHHSKFERGHFASGLNELDALLGGGLDRGTSNMFMGPPGTGKSTLALKFCMAAAEKGEKVLFLSFDETIGTMVSRAKQLGMDMDPHLKDGLIRVEQIDPAEICPGEMAHRIRMAVERESTRMVVIDSINGYLNAMPDERFLHLQLHELLAFLNQLGVITIMILAQQGLIGNMQSAVDLTYLADTVVLLRYFEINGSVKQALSVIKKRSGRHERTIREFEIGHGGVKVGRPLENFRGVLTGIPSLLHEDQT